MAEDGCRSVSAVTADAGAGSAAHEPGFDADLVTLSLEMKGLVEELGAEQLADALGGVLHREEIEQLAVLLQDEVHLRQRERLLLDTRATTRTRAAKGARVLRQRVELRMPR